MKAPGRCLVLGGARSGKSAFAERLAGESGCRKLYVASGQAWDNEMEARISAHRDRRGPEWETLEEPLDLAGVIVREAAPDRIVLVDCLTLWITNLMVGEHPIEPACEGFVDAFCAAAGPVILVSNEVGLGIVPDNRMARDFRDHAGRLHQQIAAVADRVHFVAAGLPLTLKG